MCACIYPYMYTYVYTCKCVFSNMQRKPVILEATSIKGQL